MVEIHLDDVEVLQHLISSVGEGLVACDQTGRFKLWNRAASQILGRDPDEGISPEEWGSYFGLHCPHSFRILRLQELPLWRCLESMGPVEQIVWLQAPHCPGGAWLDVRARPWFTPTGDFLGAIATFRDVTHNRWAALTMRLMGALYQSEDYAIVGFDRSGTVISWNPGAVKLWGYSQDEILGQSAFVLMPPARLAEIGLAHFFLRNGMEVPRAESRIMRKDGSVVHVARTISPFRNENEGFEGGIAVVSDITQRREVEEKLRFNRQQLRKLSARLEQVREEELLRISRELHDELGQQLTGLRLDLAWLENKLSEDRPELCRRLDSMAVLVDETLRQVRRMSAQMRPPLLDDLGLPSAITHWADKLRSRTSLEVTVELETNLNGLNRDLSLAIYRILQEASTNVLRHAQASTLKLRVGTCQEFLKMTLTDDGKGFDVQAPRPAGLGLLGMAERAHQWGGQVEICSRPGEGTCVTLRLPLQRVRSGKEPE